MKPVIAIVGRPNVGKSTFFNGVIGERISIVDDTPGITRDRVIGEAEWFGREFILIDTGGLEPKSDDLILEEMRSQAETAIAMADVIVFMTDIRAGMTATDQEIAQILRRSGKPVVVAVNKADRVGHVPAEFYEFYQLGFEKVISISAEHRLGFGELLDEILACLPDDPVDVTTKERIKIAIIGKPNSGKSSLINCMLGEKRAIVSSIAGTTRDAIDADLNNEYGSYRLIDTAGLRKKSRIDTRIERYSVSRSLAAIERSDVCLVLIDAQEGVTEQDTKVGRLIMPAKRVFSLLTSGILLRKKPEHTKNLN